MNGWRKVVSHQVIEAHRSGWTGVADAIKSAVTGKPRLTTPQLMTVSFYVRGVADNSVLAHIHAESQPL